MFVGANKKSYLSELSYTLLLNFTFFPVCTPFQNKNVCSYLLAFTAFYLYTHL